MKGLKPTFISILAIGLLAGSAVGVAAQDEETDGPTSAVLSGYFASFNENGTTLEVPEFVITFPDGGEAVVQGIFTVTGSYDGLDDFEPVSISGAGWELQGIVSVNSPYTLEELAAE